MVRESDCAKQQGVNLTSRCEERGSVTAFREDLAISTMCEDLFVCERKSSSWNLNTDLKKVFCAESLRQEGENALWCNPKKGLEFWAEQSAHRFFLNNRLTLVTVKRWHRLLRGRSFKTYNHVYYKKDFGFQKRVGAFRSVILNTLNI